VDILRIEGVKLIVRPHVPAEHAPAQVQHHEQEQQTNEITL